MIAADFLGDPTGYRIGHALPNGPTAGSCGPFLFGCNSAHGARRLHGSTKLAGAGRLWTMCCTPSISIVAQSVCMEVILPPEMRHSRPAPFRWSSEIQTGPAYPSRGRRYAQPSRRGHV